MYRSKSLTCKNSSMQGFLFLRKGAKKATLHFISEMPQCMRLTCGSPGLLQKCYFKEFPANERLATYGFAAKCLLFFLALQDNWHCRGHSMPQSTLQLLHRLCQFVHMGWKKTEFELRGPNFRTEYEGLRCCMRVQLRRHPRFPEARLRS